MNLNAVKASSGHGILGRLCVLFDVAFDFFL
jgi:hypothetical protein